MSKIRLAIPFIIVILALLIDPGCEDHSHHHDKIITFEKTIGSPDDDDLADAQPTSDGGYILLATQYDGQGNHCMWLIKTDAMADTQWTRKYSYVTSQGYFATDGASVKQTPDGGYIIGGYSGLDYPLGRDFHLIKTNSSGDTLWSRMYNHDIGDAIKSVVVTPDEGYVIAGSTSEVAGGGGVMTYLIKTNSNGDTLWTKSFPELDNLQNFKIVSGGGFVMTGYSEVEYTGNFNILFYHLDELGNVLWSKTYDIGRREEAHNIIPTQDGGYLIVGHTVPEASIYGDAVAIKTDIFGDSLWIRQYGGVEFESFFDVTQLSNNDYLFVGSTASFGKGQNDVYLVKTNSQGDTLWTRTYGGANRDAGMRIFHINDGGHFIVGSTESFGIGGSDIYSIKTDSRGLVDSDSI